MRSPTQALNEQLFNHIRQIVADATESSNQCKRQRLTLTDINATLYSHNFPQCSSTHTHASRSNLNLNSIITSRLPPAPLEASAGTHWLAVEGVQPDIPQNPKSQQCERGPAGAGAGAGGSNSSISDRQRTVLDTADVTVNQLMGTILAEELQIYYVLVISSVNKYFDAGDGDGGGGEGEGGTPGSAVQNVILQSLSTSPGLQEVRRAEALRGGVEEDEILKYIRATTKPTLRYSTQFVIGIRYSVFVFAPSSLGLA